MDNKRLLLHYTKETNGYGSSDGSSEYFVITMDPGDAHKIQPFIDDIELARTNWKIPGLTLEKIRWMEENEPNPGKLTYSWDREINGELEPGKCCCCGRVLPSDMTCRGCPARK
jgi:hypothetical protein